jgi:hypothetical protein
MCETCDDPSYWYGYGDPYIEWNEANEYLNDLEEYDRDLDLDYDVADSGWAE